MIEKGLKQCVIFLFAAVFLMVSCEAPKPDGEVATAEKKTPKKTATPKKKEKKEGMVLATMSNGEVITWEELDNTYHVERMRRRLNEEQVNRLLDNLIKERLIYLDGLEKGYDKDPEYVRQIERHKRKLINSISMRKLSTQAVDVSEEDMHKYYDAHPDSFHILKVKYIMFSPRKFGNDREKAKKEAKKASVAIKKGMSLDDAAQKFLERSKPFTINLRQGQRSFFGKSFDDAVWKLKAGETGDLIETSQGILIAQVTEDTTQTFDEAKNYLRSIMRREKSTTKITEYHDSLKKKYGVQINEEALKTKLGELLDASQPTTRSRPSAIMPPSLPRSPSPPPERKKPK